MASTASGPFSDIPSPNVSARAMRKACAKSRMSSSGSSGEHLIPAGLRRARRRHRLSSEEKNSTTGNRRLTDPRGGGFQTQLHPPGFTIYTTHAKVYQRKMLFLCRFPAFLMAKMCQSSGGSQDGNCGLLHWREALLPARTGAGDCARSFLGDLPTRWLPYTISLGPARRNGVQGLRHGR